MTSLKYTITINKAQDFVFERLIDKSVYPDWAKAWGDGTKYEGEWKKGSHISFFDNSQGGTKVLLEEFLPSHYIKAKHIAMVNPENEEVELTDEMMKKWIGSLEEYFFKKETDETTTLEIVMTVDEAFKQMFDNGWPKALEYFKAVCENYTK